MKIDRPFVLIESPYAGDVEGNVAYAGAAILDSLHRGEAPFASHLFYTRMLDDLDPAEREMGIEAGLAIGKFASKTVVLIENLRQIYIRLLCLIFPRLLHYHPLLLFPS